jgi:IclR family acetate operon transcriptional repressor
VAKKKTSGRPTNRGPSALRSVDNALNLLRLFRQTDVVRVSGVSAELEIGLSTAYRLLSTLQQRGFVEQDEKTRGYRVGPTLVEIALAVDIDRELREYMRPFIERLRNGVEETTHLLVLSEGARVRWIDAAECTELVRTSSRAGQEGLAYPTAAGKALLAELSRERVDQLFPESELAVLTKDMVSTRDELWDKLVKVKEDGYAKNFGDSNPTLGAIGVVVRDTHGQACAGIAISGPLERIGSKNSKVARNIDDMVRAATRIAQEAGAGLTSADAAL